MRCVRYLLLLEPLSMYGYGVTIVERRNVVDGRDES